MSLFLSIRSFWVFFIYLTKSLKKVLFIFRDQMMYGIIICQFKLFKHSLMILPIFILYLTSDYLIGFFLLSWRYKAGPLFWWFASPIRMRCSAAYNRAVLTAIPTSGGLLYLIIYTHFVWVNWIICIWSICFGLRSWSSLRF